MKRYAGSLPCFTSNKKKKKKEKKKKKKKKRKTLKYVEGCFGRLCGRAVVLGYISFLFFLSLFILILILNLFYLLLPFFSLSFLFLLFIFFLSPWGCGCSRKLNLILANGREPESILVRWSWKISISANQQASCHQVPAHWIESDLGKSLRWGMRCLCLDVVEVWSMR